MVQNIVDIRGVVIDLSCRIFIVQCLGNHDAEEIFLVLLRAEKAVGGVVDLLVKLFLYDAASVINKYFLKNDIRHMCVS